MAPRATTTRFHQAPHNIFSRSLDGAWAQQAYIKASNANEGDYFGVTLDLSGDGQTLAVGATHEDSASTGVNQTAESDNNAEDSGAVYVFVRDGIGNWRQEAYVKASNTDPQDGFGGALTLSGDGHVLAVAATGEDSIGTGVNGANAQSSNSATGSGAVYLFARDEGAWDQRAYVKAPNSAAGDGFGGNVALSGDGNILACGAIGEDGSGSGVSEALDTNDATYSGAAYVFVRDEEETWHFRSYVKASNPEADDYFGRVALSGDGRTLAVTADGEDSPGVGVNSGMQSNNDASNAGAVYLFETRRTPGVLNAAAHTRP